MIVESSDEESAKYRVLLLKGSMREDLIENRKIRKTTNWVIQSRLLLLLLFNTRGTTRSKLTNTARKLSSSLSVKVSKAKSCGLRSLAVFQSGHFRRYEQITKLIVSNCYEQTEYMSNKERIFEMEDA